MINDLDQSQTPLLDAMRAYADGGAAAFHTPGHKQGEGIHKKFKELITDRGLKMEVSLMDELDDLHAPAGCILAAQKLAARLYGADASYFVINGTTGAIHAMLAAALNPGDKLILPRNAHRSALGGLMLCGARAVYVRPEVDDELGIAMGCDPKAIESAMDAHPDSRAVLLVHPTYYGVTADIRKIANLVHSRGMLLLVDEAHGPHLKFHRALPMDALEAGADLVAQSTHKLIGSLTQTSMLHANFARVDRARLQAMLSLLQSTSPNYLLLASLDVARMQMASEGGALLGRAVELAQWARSEINKIDGLYCFGKERLGSPGARALDPTKLTVSMRGVGLSGAEAAKILRVQYNIQAELADAHNVLFILSIGDDAARASLLVESLRSLAQKAGSRAPRPPQSYPRYPEIPRAALSAREALFAEKTAVEFDRSQGCVSAETITFYPPGIPALCPGEIIGKETIAYCKAMRGLDLKIVGPDDVRLQSIKVVK